MRSIDGPGAVSNRFVDYDAITNPNGTVYTADFGNDVQDEIIGIQELADLTESAGTNLQLLEGLKILLPSFDPAITTWSAGSYSAGAVVFHIGKAWFCNANSTTDEPGPETDWAECSYFFDKVDGWKTAGFSELCRPDAGNFKDYYRVGRYKIGGNQYDRFRLNIYGQETVLKTSDFGKLIAESKNISLFATDNGSDYDLALFKGNGPEYDSDYVTPADWTDATFTITHDLGVSYEHLQIRGYTKSDEVGVQESLFGHYISGDNFGARTQKDSADSKATFDIVFAVNGPTQINENTGGGALNMASATNGQYRVVVKSEVSCGYVEVDVPAGTIATVAG